MSDTQDGVCKESKRGVSDCYLTQNEQFFAILWREQVIFYNEVRLAGVCETDQKYSSNACFSICF